MAKEYLNSQQELINLALKFVTYIIRPWEKLNIELTKQGSIDSNISDFITVAGNLAVQLSHFPENASPSFKYLRSDTSCREWKIIVNVADAWKHNFSDNDRANKLFLSSQFEINSDDTKYRFIRNAITIEHITYGKLDFLATAVVASQFLFDKLKLKSNLMWKPLVLEAPEVWSNEVYLPIEYDNQILWGGLKLETLRRNAEGTLIPTVECKPFTFSLKQDIPIKAVSYHDYIIQLLNKSKPKISTIAFKGTLNINRETFKYDVSLKLLAKLKTNHTLIKIINNISFNLIEFKKLLDTPTKMGFDKLIIISPNELPTDLKKIICQQDSLCFITINKFDAHNIPLLFLYNKTRLFNRKFKALNKVSFNFFEEDKHLNIQINTDRSYFSLDKKSLISFKNLCLIGIKLKPNEQEGKSEIRFRLNDKRALYYKAESTFIRIGVDAEFNWENETIEAYNSILTYDKSSSGMSIWNLEGSCKMNNNWIYLKSQAFKYGDTTALGLLSNFSSTSLSSV